MTTATPARSSGDHGFEDDQIERAVAAADLSALLPALATLTGDCSVLRPHLCFDPAVTLVPGVGLAPELDQEARALAAATLRSWRDAGRPVAPPPDRAALTDMLRFATGGNTDVDEYLPLFAEELGVTGDPAAPEWRARDLDASRTVRAIVIGAGMSGILAAHRLQQAGVAVTVFEKNADVGGTWFENRYPGCRVDVPNHFYSYSCAQKQDWPEHFSDQGVLLDYFRDCADRFGVRELTCFEHEVVTARWNDAALEWRVTVRGPGGVEREERANVLVSGVGQLNRPLLPDIEGRDDFEGPAFHSARWPEGLSLAGRRVAVIGTGASAMQLIPEVAEQASELLVFQRTPAWLIPTPDYHDAVPDEQHWLFRNVPSYSRWYRFVLFWKNAEGMLDLMRVDPDWAPGGEAVGPANEMLRLVLVEYLREQFGDEPDLLEAVTPHYPPGSKRVIRDNGIWARTLRRDDVHLITTGIERITARGVRTVDGVEHEVDVIVFGTGFQASQFLTPMQIVGRDGNDLHDRWHGDARAYLGVTVPGFPNLFLLYGPNTNIVINGSIIFFTECEVRYLVDAIRVLLETGAAGLDCRREVHDAYNDEVDAANRSMAWGAATHVRSWYRNATGRSAQNWPFSLLEYWKRTRAVDPSDYELLR